MTRVQPCNHCTKRFCGLAALFAALALLAAGLPSAAGDEGQTSAVQVGDKVTLGHYEQDNDAVNGPESISWLVLEVSKDKALLVTEYNLDCRPYNAQKGPVTWEGSSLREWLNKDFLDAAFTLEEQTAILEVTIHNEDNPDHGTRGGNDTNDRIFLLSLAEAGHLFQDDPARRARNSAFAMAHGAYADYDGFGEWWLRSPGIDSCNAAFIYHNGEIGYASDGNTVEYPECVVRPAMYVDLSSAFFDKPS